MLLDRKWILREFSPAYGGEAGVEEKLAQMGVGADEPHVSFMILFAIAVDLVRSLNDEMCGLTEQKVPFGTWEMMIRSMSTAKTLDNAIYTLIQTSRIFTLPYKIDLRDQGDSVFVEVIIHDKKNPKTSFLEAAYGRLIWASFCWFSGRQIPLLAISNNHSYYDADNRDAAGAPVRPFESDQPGIPSLVAAEVDGFAVHKSNLGAKSAIRRDTEPLIESFKWFGTLNYSVFNENDDARFPEMDILHNSFSVETSQLFRNIKQTKFKDAETVQAKVLLSSTNKSIAEIAFELGFPTEQSFRKSFQKASGETPTQYRDQYETGALLGSDHLLDQIIGALK